MPGYHLADLNHIIRAMQPRCAVCADPILSPHDFVIASAPGLGKEAFFHVACAPFIERGWKPAAIPQ